MDNATEMRQSRVRYLVSSAWVYAFYGVVVLALALSVYCLINTLEATNDSHVNWIFAAIFFLIGVVFYFCMFRAIKQDASSAEHTYIINRAKFLFRIKPPSDNDPL